MLGQFDIDSTTASVEQIQPVYERNELTFAEGPHDLYEGTLIICGDGEPGGVVRGQGNVIVKGSLLGNDRKPIRIEVDGQVVVTGHVSHAIIDASCIYVGESVSDSQINTRLGLEVGGDVGTSQIRVGEYDLVRKKIDQLKKRLDDGIWERNSTERKLKSEEKRVDKLFKNTRVELAANVGRIVQAQHNRLVVNLAPIYESLQGRTEADIEKALKEFFAKAVVGLLTRANRHFLVGESRHRREIFKGIVRDVHDLFFLTRKFDKQVQSCMVLNQAVDDAIEAANGRISSLFVRGKVLADTAVSFTIPEVAVSDIGKVLISGDLARFDVTLAQGGGLNVQCVNTLGVKTHHVVDAEALQCCQMSVAEGEVIWPALEMLELA